MGPYSNYLPDEAIDGAVPPAINIVYGNTADHFRTHAGWIRECLGLSWLKEEASWGGPSPVGEGFRVRA